MSFKVSDHKEIIEKICFFARESPKINALITLGSVARNDFRPFSDVDIALIIEEEAKEEIIYKNVEKIFQEDLLYSFPTSPKKFTLFLGIDLLKVDIFIVKKFEEIEEYFWGSCIPDPLDSVLYDKKNLIKKKILSNDSSRVINVSSEIKNEINKFLYAFEAFSIAHRTSDAYRSYFEYNLALHRLVRIVYLLRGGREFLFLPRKFHPSYLNEQEQKIFPQLNGKINLRAVNKTKRLLLDFFYKIIEEIKTRLSIKIDSKEIMEFCEAIYERDYFWNLRDIAKYNPCKIRQNQLFRSSVLSEYLEDNYFRIWMKEKKIKTIIDLRTTDEVSEKGYPQEFLEKVNYFNIPLVPTIKKETKGSLNQEALSESYRGILESSGDKFKEIFDILAEKLNYPIIIHCYAGKDRTGIVIALIHLLLGSHKEIIVKDYLTSSMDSKCECIESLLEFIISKGGISRYLDNQNVTLKSQEHILVNLKL